MITWVGNKNVDMHRIHDRVLQCIRRRHFTNNGENVLQLQEKIKTIFYIDPHKEVLLTCNGAMGLNALIGGFNIYFNKTLRWVVQSFTFPSSVQGNLQNSIVLDVDTNMGPNIDQLTSLLHKYDGIVITNCFGTSVNIVLYDRFCRKHHKLLVFDNAAAPMTFYNNKNHINYGHACIVSLHHTKPIGFGEGGFIVFDKEYVDSMKRAICFGYTDTNKYQYHVFANNYKMSEISCIFIDAYMENVSRIYNHHTRMIQYFCEKIKDINHVQLFPNFSEYKSCLLSTLPILFDKKINVNKFIENGIEAKKYYYPLGDHPKSKDLFDRIICLPLNLDISEKVLDLYVHLIANA